MSWGGGAGRDQRGLAEAIGLFPNSTLTPSQTLTLKLWLLELPSFSENEDNPLSQE